ncbi:domain of Kin17 curved DNA-binding protein-domain-containing protein [Jimgerdemannia flammicorona]|uniref:Domain of Kin17 curved DNA-binding protein-domain-containing protein n=1 Tax=Jimgerdemannia flammicorona TaxID=994334 RepID=A0A433QXM0_9FUNG|nr:domain of Kin17 curved DNA-binding protein-domain-containing protein [Jimgerdemannia flammicorona]
MGKDGFLTPKAIANRIKAKGLQKLKWYCQACEKQCRDENGYKCHMTSESHLRQLLLIAETPDTYLDNYSQEFKSEFIKLLSRRYNTKRVLANQVYQEFIADRHHLHMNATHWDTLTDFVKHLGREGICHVDETPKGWFITWIDNSPKALERQAANQKRERQDMDDEQREQRMIQEQIERARLESSGSGLNSSGREDQA